MNRASVHLQDQFVLADPNAIKHEADELPPLEGLQMFEDASAVGETLARPIRRDAGTVDVREITKGLIDRVVHFLPAATAAFELLI